MPCFHPIKGFRAPNGTVTFNKSRAYADVPPITVACGRCAGCRLEYSRQWAIRCMHEASLYERNCFITLTYDEANCPKDMSLDVREWQLFMKRLKSHVRRKMGKSVARGIRFYHCGEYGSRYGRPHYHAILFNFDFNDRVLHARRKSGNVYISDTLAEIWGKGFCTVGDCTFESAAYCARYIMKKQTGEEAQMYYEWFDEYGEVHDRKPEYCTMSRGGRYGKGLAHGWFEKYRSDVYPDDFVVVNGKRCKPPRYYNGQYELADEKQWKRIRFMRKKRARRLAGDNTKERLRVKEVCLLARLKRLERNVE